MITLIDKTPVTAQKHREYMTNAHRIDAVIVMSRIRSSNTKLYVQMGSPASTSKKLVWDFKTGMMVRNNRRSDMDAYATPDMYIVKCNGITYYLKRNGL